MERTDETLAAEIAALHQKIGNFTIQLAAFARDEPASIEMMTVATSALAEIVAMLGRLERRPRA